MAQAAGGPEALRAKRGFVIGMGNGFPRCMAYSGGGGLTGSMEPRGFQAADATPVGNCRRQCGYVNGGDIARSMRSYGTEFTEAERAFAVMAGKGIPGLKNSPCLANDRQVASSLSRFNYGRRTVRGAASIYGYDPRSPAGANRLYSASFRKRRGHGVCTRGHRRTIRWRSAESISQHPPES